MCSKESLKGDFHEKMRRFSRDIQDAKSQETPKPFLAFMEKSMWKFVIC
jgi:hypothetical protein